MKFLSMYDTELFSQFSRGKLKNPQTHKLVELFENSLDTWFIYDI